MIAPILSVLFPPDPRKIIVPHGALLLYAIRKGEVEAVPAESSLGWAGNVREWRNGRWREISKDE